MGLQANPCAPLLGDTPAASVPKGPARHPPKKGPGQGIDPCPSLLIPAARSYERLRVGDQKSTSLAIEAGSVLTLIAAWLGPRMPGQAFRRLPPGERPMAPPLTAIARKTMLPVVPVVALAIAVRSPREAGARLWPPDPWPSLRPLASASTATQSLTMT